MPAKSRLTLFQLFFLSFAYVFSGLFLIGERSFLSLLVPLVSALVYCALGYCFLATAPMPTEGKDRWLSFLSGGKPHLCGKVTAELLAFFAAAELILSWLAFASSVQGFSEFMPFALAAALILLLAVFFGAHGLTAVGRFSELLVFLILPLLFWLVFWDFAPIDFRAFSDDPYVWLVVLPSPILYTFSMTVLQSTAVPKPVGHRAVIPLVSLGGAVTAVLCAVLFLLYGADENNIFLLLFGWSAATVRLALLVCVCTASGSGRITWRLREKDAEQIKKASTEES